MKNNKLEIVDLHVSVEGKKILKGFSLSIKSGEIHAIMGPNGSGKSTLCYAVMGHPKFKITKGDILINGKSIVKLTPDKRANAGLYLGFQYPHEVEGVTFGNFLRTVFNSLNNKSESIGPIPFYKMMEKEIERIKMDKSFIGRSLNEGFSGGEKKRAEIVQMALLKPKFAILDEIDSGLDIDALKQSARVIRRSFEEQNMGILLITHYQRILNYLKPDFVHIMVDGKIIESGGEKLAEALEQKGYENLIPIGV